MVEFEYDGVRLTAIDARMFTKILEDEVSISSSVSDLIPRAPRFQGVFVGGVVRAAEITRADSAKRVSLSEPRVLERKFIKGFLKATLSTPFHEEIKLSTDANWVAT